MIQINQTYAITSNAAEWRLCKHRDATEKNPEHWEPFKYFSSLSGCIAALRGILLRTSNYSSAEELLANLEEVDKLLTINNWRDMP